MIKLKHKVPAFLILASFISCTGGEPGYQGNAKKETPKALQHEPKKKSMRGYSDKSDLTDELYNELVEKSEPLKKLEDELGSFMSAKAELEEKFNSFNNKSESYYNSADHHASSIMDSLLRIKMMSFISGSRNKFEYKTAEFHSMLKLISQKNTTLNDHHSAMKIVLTMPLIETYQADHSPDKKEFKDIMRQQEKLIQRMDSLTPKY